MSDARAPEAPARARSAKEDILALNVLITGANSGFGLLSAEAFARAGHTVHAGYRNPEKLAGLEALRTRGFVVEPVRLDVTAPDMVREVVAKARQTAPIDVLVNNAGFEMIGPVDEFTEESFQRQFDTNVVGMLRMVRAVSPDMRARRSGAIVNMSSMVGRFSVPYAGLYAASKHAVEALTEALWFELKPFDVRVAMVEPGGYATSFEDNTVAEPAFGPRSPHWAFASRFRDASQKFVEQNSAVQDPREVAAAVLEAATTSSPRLRWLVGRDANTLVPFYRSQDFEGFASAMLETLGLSNWGNESPAPSAEGAS